jgi:hypothetical protein
MGSALIDAETINELAKAAGVVSKVEEITKRAMCGDLDFRQVLAERVSLLEKAGFTIAFNPTHPEGVYGCGYTKEISNPLFPFLNLLLICIVIRHSMLTSNSRIT